MPLRRKSAQIAEAIEHLKAARNTLLEAGARRAHAAACRAIVSAVGAHRHAQEEEQKAGIVDPVEPKAPEAPAEIVTPYDRKSNYEWR